MTNRFPIMWLYDSQGLARARRFSDLKTWVRASDETDEEFSRRVADEAAVDVEINDAKINNTQEILPNEY